MYTSVYMYKVFVAKGSSESIILFKFLCVPTQHLRAYNIDHSYSCEK
jgi:hypothetical protein